MYGQMTAGSWIYIGSQGILQGTYETLAVAGPRHFGGSLAGRSVVTAGLGGMGGAQPLAVTMNGGAALVIEVDPAPHRPTARDGVPGRGDALAGRCARQADGVDAHEDGALDRPRGQRRRRAAGARRPRRVPDVVTDQTSAHDALNGYVPNGLSLEAAAALRAARSRGLRRAIDAGDGRRTSARCSSSGRRGSHVFDYGNNIRAQAEQAGVTDAFDIPGFVPEYIRPLFCEGKGPFRWAALSGDPADIAATDRAVLELFPDDEALARWIRLAGERVKFQGLPARICWLGYGERAKFGLHFNEMVRTRRAEGADRHRPRSPRRGLRGVAESRDGRHARRQRRDRGLADPQRAAQHGGRRDVGVGASRRRRRHRLLAARRHGRRRRRHAPRPRSVSSACSPAIPGWASCGTPMPAIPRRSPRRRRAASTCRWRRRAGER